MGVRRGRGALPLLAPLVLWLAAAQAAASAPETDPVAVVRTTAERVLAALERERETLAAHPERIYELVDAHVLPRFDFEAMARFVLGRHWRRASPEQRRRFVEEFRALLVRSYATALLEYGGEPIEYLPPRGNPAEGEVTVRTRIPQPGGFPIEIDYRMRRGADGRWRVIDVAVDGVSLLANYRSSFAAELRTRDLDGLIRTLAARNRGGR
ncbi:MAG TPA: ABC transporter substrate-binding protein [Chromatiales bacterium]|nr:ABC transporter substrate-binding protein [Chromatiales bacterium]